MLDQGWFDEVAALVRSGMPLSAKPFEFLDYRELRARIEEGTPSPKVLEAIAQDPRRQT